MSDDLVKRLRSLGSAGLGRISFLASEDAMKAADRIETLEASEAEWQTICDSYAAENQRFSDRIEKLEAALRKIADIEHEDLPKPVGAAEGTLWVILAGCVEVAEKALEGKND
jgi:hypothetical protein